MGWKERLLCCEHATRSRDSRRTDGAVTVIASAYEGKALNSLNDIVVKRDGGIYFTDSTYSRMVLRRSPQAGPGLPWRVPRQPDGAAIRLLADDFAQPNGLCFSIDERHLFVNDTARMHVRVFDVVDDGTLRKVHLGWSWSVYGEVRWMV